MLLCGRGTLVSLPRLGVEFPSAIVICTEGLNWYVSSANLPLNLLYLFLCDFSSLSNSYMIKTGDVTHSSSRVWCFET